MPVNTRFSFEVPIAHLEDFDDLNDFHFCLSMLFDNLAYDKYHRRVVKKGLKTIWVDNSFNEKFVADEAHDLIHYAGQFSAAKVVAPDSIHWDLEQIADAWKVMRSHLGSNRTIVVCRNYNMFLEMTKLPITTVAVSYWKRSPTEGWEWSNDELRKVREAGYQLHFLGLNNIDELLTVCPDSCDTSMPVKIALQGKTLRQWMEEGCPHINTKDLGFQGSDFFGSSMTSEQVTLARRNICDLKNLLLDTNACVKY